MQRFSQHSHYSDTTAVQHTESEENIIPLSKAMVNIEEAGVGRKAEKSHASSRTNSIMKTTEVEVLECEKEDKEVQQRKW